MTIINQLFVLLLSLQVVSLSAAEVRVFYQQTKTGYTFYASNPNPVPYWLKMEFLKLKNLHSSHKPPVTVVLSAGQKNQKILQLTPKNKYRSYSFQHRYFYDIGDPLNARHDDSVKYLFPFPHGSKYKLTQGFHGEFSHIDWQAYSLDFGLPTGSPIVAARTGIVALAVEHNTIGGPTESYGKYANKILILHEDGSIASYVHLKQGGSLVRAGDKVEAGQLIGYSGNTGFSQGPHLHFDIVLPTFQPLAKTIPFKMLDVDGQAIEPVAGQYYYSYHPGKSDFAIQYGKDIQLADYDGYQKALSSPKQQIKVRLVEVDDTQIFFIQNTFSQKYSIKMDFQLENLHLFSNRQGNFEVAANSEIFFGFLKPEDATEEWSYQYRYSYFPISKSGSESSLEPGVNSEEER